MLDAHGSQVRRHVEEVMKVVELDVLRDSLVGVPGQSGLSVEARKRLSIAVEQVSIGYCMAIMAYGIALLYVTSQGACNIRRLSNAADSLLKYSCGVLGRSRILR
jgi:hypothetical protein